MKIVWHCALNSRTGFSEVSEGIIKALHKEGADVYAHSWGQWGLPEDDLLRSLIQKYETNKDSLFDACHIICWAPEEYHTFKGKRRLGIAFAESSIIRNSILSSCSQIEGVIVISNITKKMFAASGYTKEIIFMPPAAKDVYHNRPIIRPVSKNPDEFVFLAVGVCQLRKNSFMLAEEFSNVFPKDKFPKIKLIMKSNQGGRLDWTRELKGNIEAIWTGPEAGVPDYTTEQMYDLYSRCDCLLLPSKGEGGPLVEALAVGLPIIYTDWGVLKEFFNSDISYPCRIGYMEKGSFSNGRGLCEPFGETAQVDINHFRALMKHVVENRNDLRDKSIHAAVYGSYFKYDITAKTLLKALS